MDYLHYLELSANPIRFDAVSQLTNVFFDDSNQQVFAVRSGGATGVVVKSGKNEAQNLSFCMEDKGPIRSIKFSPDNKILALQRIDASVEFITFNNNQPILNDVIVYKGKNTIVYGFVWLHLREVVLISNQSVEIFQISLEKKQLKSIKSCNLTINWFSWCPTGNFALLSSNNGAILTPILLKQGTIVKLPKLDLESGRNILERDVTLAQLYGTASILILKQISNRAVEIVIYTLNGPGLAPKRSHILRLDYSGRLAMNIVDDLIIVHHQSSKTSMIFDIASGGELDAVNNILCHRPVTAGKPLKPFSLKLPSISLDGQSMNCELYSPTWVLFQPNIVIDAKLGCLWYVNLNLENICAIVTERVRLVEFLLQRTNGKPVLLAVLREMMSSQYGTMLPIMENIFDKLNVLYKTVLDNEVQSQTATPTTIKSTPQKQLPQPRVVIDQSDIYTHVFATISETEHVGKLLMLYLNSLTKNGITAQHDLSKMMIIDLVRSNKLITLQQLLKYSIISESKPLACFLLSLSNIDPSIEQMAMDMLTRLNANEIILEVLLEQGKVIDALRLAKSMPSADSLQARKYLESALKTKDPVIFHSVYTFFQLKNIRIRGSPDFLKNEQCAEYILHYQSLLANK